MQMKMIRNEEGFTLIEIIAVLVILGILLAIALPKYTDVVTHAKKTAAMGAVAAAKSALSMRYAQVLLSTSAAPTADALATATTPNCGVDAGDFTVTCTAGTGVVTISAAGNGTSLSGAVGTGTFTLP